MVCFDVVDESSLQASRIAQLTWPSIVGQADAIILLLLDVLCLRGLFAWVLLGSRDIGNL